MNDIYQVMKGTKFYTKPIIVNIMSFAAENELMVVLGEWINCTNLRKQKFYFFDKINRNKKGGKIYRQ